MEITILITPKGSIHKEPILSFKGLPILDEEDFTYGLQEEIENIAKTFSLNSKKQQESLIEALKNGCKKYAKKKTGKKPFTNINIFKI